MEAHVGSCAPELSPEDSSSVFAERAQASEGDSMPERMANKAKGKSAGVANQASDRLGPKADAATDKARNVASSAQSGAQQSSGGCGQAPQGSLCMGN